MDFNRYVSKEVSGHLKTIFDIKWNKEGNYLSIISSEKSVKISQLGSTGQASTVHNIPCTSVMAQTVWHPSMESRLAMCGDDKAVEIWDVRASRAAQKMSSLGSNINMSWSPCGNYIAVGNKSDNLVVLDVRTGTQCKKQKFLYEVNEFKWTANSDYIVAATGGEGFGSIDLIEFVNGELNVVETIAAHCANCVSLSVDAVFRRMAVTSMDFNVSLWDLNDLICLHTVSLDADARSLSFSGDGSYLAFASDDPKLYICDSDTGEPLAAIALRHKISSLAWHPKQNLIAVGMEDRSPVPQNLRFISFP